MSKIVLENMEFFAYHGCFKEEQIIGNPFVVNLEIDTPTQFAEKSDKLEDTVNYQAVYNIINEQMQQKSHLLEHIGRRILNAVSENFPEIDSMELKISKMNPPLGGAMKSVSLILNYNKHA